MIVTLSLLISISSHAGAISGGGGKGVVCRGASGSITSAQTLDLYEANIVYGRKIKAFSGDIEQIILSLENDLRSTMDQPEIHLFPLIDNVRSIFHLIPENVVLTPVNDAAEVVTPVGCKIEQLANYVDDNLILVNAEIWSHLSVTDQAALIFHEAIYRLDRYGGATNSSRTRKIVSYLFSEFNFIQVKSDLPRGAKVCMASQGDRPTFQFSYYPSPDGRSTNLQFFLWEGKAVYSKKIVSLPIETPVLPHIGACSDSQSGCNFSGGVSSSNFESNQNLAVGIITSVSDSYTSLRLYFLTETGRHYIDDCGF